MKLKALNLFVLLTMLLAATACNQGLAPTKTVVMTSEVVVSRQAMPVVGTVVATEQVAPTPSTIGNIKES
jgi:hypothetical protein